MKYPVTERALMARINRKLKHEDRVLRRCGEGSRSYNTLGRYYVLDTHKNIVVDLQVDLSHLAGELDAMTPHEELVED